MVNNRFIRVDVEFYNWIKEVAKRNGKSITKMSKELCENYSYPEKMENIKPKRIKI